MDIVRDDYLRDHPNLTDKNAEELRFDHDNVIKSIKSAEEGCLLKMASNEFDEHFKQIMNSNIRCLEAWIIMDEINRDSIPTSLDERKFFENEMKLRIEETLLMLQEKSFTEGGLCFLRTTFFSRSFKKPLESLIIFDDNFFNNN